MQDDNWSTNSARARNSKKKLPLENYTYTSAGELKIYSRAVRSSFSLPYNERIALLFILDRTIGWHKVSELIYQPEFLHGVRCRRGGRWIVVVQGTGLTLEELSDALLRLQDRGAIRIERIGEAVAYALNPDWYHPNLEGLGTWELHEGNYEYAEEIEDGE